MQIFIKMEMANRKVNLLNMTENKLTTTTYHSSDRFNGAQESFVTPDVFTVEL